MAFSFFHAVITPGVKCPAHKAKVPSQSHWGTSKPTPRVKKGKKLGGGGGGTSGPDKDDDDGKKCLPACLPAALHLNSINNEASELFRHNLDNLLPHIHLELSFRLHKTRWRLGRQY